MKYGRGATSPPAHSSSANWNPAHCSVLITLRNKPTLSQQGGRKSSRGKKNPTTPHQQAPSLPTTPGPAPLHFDPPSTRLQRWQRGATFVLHSPSPQQTRCHAAGTGNCVLVPAGGSGRHVPCINTERAGFCSQAAAPVLGVHLPELWVRSSHEFLNPGAPFHSSERGLTAVSLLGDAPQQNTMLL